MEIRVKKEGIFPVKVIYADNAENIENLLNERPLQVVGPNKNFTKLKKGGRIVLDCNRIRTQARFVTP